MQLDLGPISLDYQEIVDTVKNAVALATGPRTRGKILDCVPREDLLHALSHVLKFVLNDRLNDGIGAGGWGRSDKLYMSDMYGPENGAATTDSVMTTVAVVEALHAANGMLRRSTSTFARTEWPRVWDNIKAGVNNYTRSRWDQITGEGGSMRRDREGTPRRAPSYRHTAWFLRLCPCNCGYVDATRTAQYLRENFSSVRWEEEKVATPVATLRALDWISREEGLSQQYGRDLLATQRQRVQQIICSKFSEALCGWVSGRDDHLGRQVYTLYTLSDLACVGCEDPSPLGELMSRSLAATLTGPWRGSAASGIPARPGAEASVSISCLAVSALLSRHQVSPLSESEEAIFEPILRFVIRAVRSEDGWQASAYAWAVSYFLKDICALLAQS